jgi:hypothetical protein
LCILTLFFLSCATIPKDYPIVQEEDFSLLPSGGKLYLWANVNEARPILESVSFEGLDLKQAKSILERTGNAAAVFYESGSEERFFLTLRGKYPTFQAGFSLTFSRDWKKLKSPTGNSFWASPRYGLNMALGSELALVSGGGDPFVSSAAAKQNQIQSPQGFDEFREAGVIAGWVNEPGTLINQFMSAFGIPIQIPAEDFFFTVSPGSDSDEKAISNLQSDEFWELAFLIRTPSAIQARAILTLFSLARTFIINDLFAEISLETEEPDIRAFLPLFFANLPVREDANLIIRLGALSTEELALLFEAFSVYSTEK